MYGTNRIPRTYPGAADSAALGDTAGDNETGISFAGAVPCTAKMLQEGGGFTEKVNFELGERRYVCIKVMSSCKKAFDVTSARYVLKNGSQEEASGECEITQKSDTETILSALIQPMIKGGAYTLEYTYEIPPEILKHEVRICVS